MKALLDLFPASNFSLIAVILAAPLLGAFVNGVFGRRLGKDAVRLMALSAIGVSFAAAIATFLCLDTTVGLTGPIKIENEEVALHAHSKLVWLAWNWMSTTGPKEINVPIDLKFSVDALSGVMMLVVTGVGFLIHVYSSSYMAEDKAYWRFFAYLNLFIFSMLVLILGDNLPVLFVGWEGVGLCSYLLIGFWYDKSANASAGKKAFIMNRIGDFGLICGMFLLVAYCGALDWSGLANGAKSLINPTDALQIHLWPIGGGQFQDSAIGGINIPLHLLQPNKPITISAATAVGLALFLGCTGKSAQLPLYTWLPDAMAGPTPVSALIHAATMVTAGLYLICRLNFIFVLSPAVMTIIAVTGALTALYAASLAMVQNDIKKVLAFSTVSQLGFMFLGVGVGAFTAGFFHVFTHAFFKACLFLGAGSVIHAMHVRIHDDVRSQDMRNMGGLRKYMPITYWTFVASTVAIIGLPLTSGWFSKDEILASALVSKSATQPDIAKELVKRGVEVWTAPSWMPWFLWGVGTLAATMTAFYMCRCLFMTFWGDFKGWTIGRPSQLHKAAHAAVAAAAAYDGHAEHEDDEDDQHHHHEEDLGAPGYAPHESPRAMTVPLIILGTAAIVAGLFNPSAFKIFNAHFDSLPMEHWLAPVFAESFGWIKPFADEHAVHSRELISLAGAFLAFAVGTGLAYKMYVTDKGKTEVEYIKGATTVAAYAAGGVLAVIGALIFATSTQLPGRVLAGIFIVLGAWIAVRCYQRGARELGFDFYYEKSAVAATDALADTAASVDQGIVDFVIARLTSLIVSALGTILRVAQNGVVHVYAAIMVIGLVVVGWFFVQPHADLTVTENKSGDYVLAAGGGIGYGYKWYPKADGPANSQVFTGESQLKIHLEEGASQTVRLEVANSFGRTTTKEVVLTRPKPEPKEPMKLGER